MNCDTGQITNDPELIAEWRRAGVKVLDLPIGSEMDTLTTEAFVAEPVAPEPTPRERLDRALWKAELNRLCGKR